MKIAISVKGLGKSRPRKDFKISNDTYKESVETVMFRVVTF